MKTVDILQNFRKRVTWPVMQKLLRSNGGSPGQGWSATIDKYQKADDQILTSNLEAKFREQILCGNKHTKFFEVDDTTLQALRQAALSLEIPKSEFSDEYPVLLEDVELNEASDIPIVTAREQNDDGIAIVYCCKVQLTSRELLAIGNEFKDPTRVRAEYDEIIGLKFRSSQIFGVLWLPHHEADVEVRVDVPEGMRADISSALMSAMCRKASELVSLDFLKSPRNFFPLIEKMYENRSEGTVVELSFNTNTNSVKNEKMRARKLCLRDELYHKGGKGALTSKIEPFRISLTWDVEIEKSVSSKPELTISVGSRVISSLSNSGKIPTVDSVAIRNCTGLVDFEHVKERINNYF